MGTPMKAAMPIPMRILLRLANTDIQNLLSWVEAINALKVGPGKNPLNRENSGLVKRKPATSIQRQAKPTRPIISYFQPKSRLPKTAFNPTCLGSLYMNRLIDFNAFFPCIGFFNIAVTKSFQSAHLIQGFADKGLIHQACCCCCCVQF